MLINIEEFNKVYDAFVDIRANGGTWLHSVLGDMVRSDSLYYSTTDDDLFQDYTLDNDFEHYHHFYLPALINLMKQIKTGKIDISEHVFEVPGTKQQIVDVESVYLRWNCISWLDGIANEIRNFDVQRREGHWLGECTKDELESDLRGALQYYSTLPGALPLAQEWLTNNPDCKAICIGILPEEQIPETKKLPRQTLSSTIRKQFKGSKRLGGI